MNFEAHVQKLRQDAAKQFRMTYGMNLEQWNTMTWDEWHKIPVFEAMRLVPLGGRIRFMNTELEELSYSYAVAKGGVLLGVDIEARPDHLFSGAVRASEGDVDDAAREAITTLIELAYLRGK